jgi:hypothetical protein
MVALLEPSLLSFSMYLDMKIIQPNKADGGGDGTLAMNNRPLGSGLAICKHQIDKWAVILPSV